MYVGRYACMYAMYVCMYVIMYVIMYACVCVHVYIATDIGGSCGHLYLHTCLLEGRHAHKHAHGFLCVCKRRYSDKPSLSRSHEALNPGARHSLHSEARL